MPITLPTRSIKEEIKQQRDLLWRERWARLPLTLLAIAMTTIYLPIRMAVVCAMVNLGAELASMLYMRALDPRRHPKRYHFVIACVAAMEFCYVLPAILIWQGDENYAKAFAVGMLCTTLMQMIGARSIHMPFGYFAFVAAAVPSLVGNAYYWIGIDNHAGLAVSTLALSGALTYTLVAMKSNNRLHVAAALDRAAAVDSSKAKSRFLAQMSHELRTPMNAILGMGHAELRRAKDNLSENRLSVLITSAEGLSTILDDILDMSAIESGRLSIRPKPVVPAQEIMALLNLFQPAITNAGLELIYTLSPQLGAQWLLDPQRLRQCMTNLLSNALKNTTHGSITVTADLDIAPSLQSGPQMGAVNAGKAIMRIEIADTGPGIPSHRHSSLFEPFSQARRPQVGTESNGLGLSICRTMARQMGGDVTIATNTEGESGAHFIFTLQLGVAPPTSEPATDAPKPIAPRLAPNITSLQVLVVDDIATNRLVASTYLRMLGATMIEAASGAQALEILTRSQPDLVLLDMNMPEMNGIETLEQIRALPGPVARVPVIAMTADAMPDHRAHYLAAGLDGYLAKPINPARIETEIKAVLDKARGSRPE
ncbi:response regulator [Pseudorhodobacter sp. W20_MBD10_FR17]|uniref:response regulator n=1 Tax=Pseudorhodobacter sp. W20_MBD10_FR17 TaxID=3240266 RepID=UPI003F9CE390